MPKSPGQVDALSDAELDDRLTRLYRQHLASSPAQRGAWHALIVVVLAEQKRRRDEALGLNREELTASV